MTFSFDPDAVEENIFELITPGEYESAIEEVEIKTSKAGNEMLVVAVRVYTGETERVVWDYIVNPSSLWKLKAICKCCDLEFTGDFDEQLLVGKRMRVRIKIRKGTDGWADKNEIGRYLPLAPVSAGTGTHQATKEGDVPF